MTYSHSHANRGMGLEQLIDHANHQYYVHGIAAIKKIPTPIKRINKRLPGMRPNEFIAVYGEDSTVDYLGYYNGKSIAFEAKQCHEATRFPLKNVKEHQVEWLQENITLGNGTSFLLIEMTALNKIYRVPFDHFYLYWELAQAGRRQSIPIASFQDWVEVKSSRGIVLDYLA